MKKTLVVLFILNLGCGKTQNSAETTDSKTETDISNKVTGAYLLENEKVAYSFLTRSNKRLMIAMDKSEKYLVYRYGSEDKVELEFPSDKTNSWSQFAYHRYTRPAPESMTNLSLSFTIGDFTYSVYDNTSEGENDAGEHVSSHECGININRDRSNIDIEGLLETRVGSLWDLESIEKLPKR